jgi:hypothetical protein
MKSPITRRSAPEIIRLLDFCYKRGVVDACEVEDDIAVEEWYRSMIGSGHYGLVCMEEEECDWKRWRFFLLRWCRENRLSSLGYDYIDSIRKPSGFWYLIIPMTMRFYLLGVKEWVDYPNPLGMALFKSKIKVRWPKDSTIKNMRNDDYISLIQEFIYELRKSPMEEMKDFSSKSMDNFEIAMWQVTRPQYGKIR